MSQPLISHSLPIQGDRVLIVGNRSYKNMGDELILLGTIRLLQQQGKKILISAYDPAWLQSFFAQFPDMDEIEYLHEFPKGMRSAFKYFFSKRIRELATYRKVDAVIIGGGEILTEESKDAYRYRNLALLPLIGKLRQVAIYLMGGIQIPQKPGNLRLFRWLLSKTRAIYARDEDSVRSLQEYGYQQASWFMDTSWFAQDWSSLKAQLSSPKSDSKLALLNLNKNGERFFPELVQECKHLLDAGYQLKYIPVSKGTSPVYDDARYQQYLEVELGCQIQTLDWESDFSAFLQEVQKADVVITARLHLFLIASFLGVETKVFPYQKKILKMQTLLDNLKLTKK